MAHPAELDELAPAWGEVCAKVRETVGDSAFEIWLAPLKLTSWDGSVLTVSAPVATRAWVAKRFGGLLERCARGVLGGTTTVSFAGLTCDHDPHPQVESPPVASSGPSRGGRLNPRYSFDQFIIGAGNRLAHAASLAVAEHPGQAYNPLFLHAPPGLGKTHLLHAIGNYILGFGSGATVRYTSVEAFTNHFIGALTSHTLDRFKHAYRDADVLLVDDIQFLGSKAKTGEEFFHTFNALHESGRQLVLTCDRLPRQLLQVEERLRERFEAGLVADIEPPDYATRLTILRKRAALDCIPVGDGRVLEVVAERITDNVRVLEGALIRIVAHHSLSGHPIDIALAEHVLDGIAAPAAKHRPTIQKIQETVGRYFGLSVEELCSTTRTAHVAWARQVAIHLTRETTDHPTTEIGAAFGGRNHATVLHACKRVADRLSTDAQAAADVNKLTEALGR